MTSFFAIQRPDGTLVLESIAQTDAEAWRRAVKYCQVRRDREGNSGYACIPVHVLPEAPEPVARLLHRKESVYQGLGMNVIARTFEEFSCETAIASAHWTEGANLYLGAPPSTIRQEEREP